MGRRGSEQRLRSDDNGRDRCRHISDTEIHRAVEKKGLENPMMRRNPPFRTIAVFNARGPSKKTETGISTKPDARTLVPAKTEGRPLFIADFYGDEGCRPQQAGQDANGQFEAPLSELLILMSEPVFR
jgi:hypothetical protein